MDRPNPHLQMHQPQQHHHQQQQQQQQNRRLLGNASSHTSLPVPASAPPAAATAVNTDQRTNSPLEQHTHTQPRHKRGGGTTTTNNNNRSDNRPNTNITMENTTHKMALHRYPRIFRIGKGAVTTYLENKSNTAASHEPSINLNIDPITHRVSHHYQHHGQRNPGAATAGPAEPGNNMQVTSKYTKWTFVPKNLFEQFITNMANMYFLLIAILQMVEPISTTDGIPTILQPLAFVVVVSGARALHEDYVRHGVDSVRNSVKFDVFTSLRALVHRLALPVKGVSENVCRPVGSYPHGTKRDTAKKGQKLQRQNDSTKQSNRGDRDPCADGNDDTTATFCAMASGQLHVGDIIKIRNGDVLPADVLLLGSSHLRGHAFVDQSNINGESTLEIFTSVSATRSYCATEAMLNDLAFTIAYEAPNSRIGSFHGTIKMKSTGILLPVDGKSLLLRDTQLKNTNWIIGVVIYNGQETKVRYSNVGGDTSLVSSRFKQSRLMAIVDQILIRVFAIQVVLCTIAGIVAGQWLRDHQDGAWYLDFSHVQPERQGMLAFLTTLILVAQMIPIALVVSAEVVKFIQAYFIKWDVQLYDANLGAHVSVNNSGIHEDLGVIDYVVTDKTGTLTQNKMQFRYALLENDCFGSKDTDIQRAVQARYHDLAARVDPSVKRLPPILWTDVALQSCASSGGDELFGKTRSTADVAFRVDQRHHEQELGCSSSTRQGRDRGKSNCCGMFWNTNPASDLVLREHFPDEHELHDSDDNGDRLEDRHFTNSQRDELLQALHGQFNADAYATRGDDQRSAKTLRKLERKAQSRLYNYMLHMALSNTVRPLIDEHGTLHFQADSPEEMAMVEFARSCGFEKIAQNPTRVRVTKATSVAGLTNGPQVEEVFNHIATFGFTPARSRVTLIYQSTMTRRIHVMTKGQDSAVLPLISDYARRDALLAHMYSMCSNGLRTLVVAEAILPSQWWAPRMAEYAALLNHEQDSSANAAGHETNECAGSPACVQCRMHEWFEDVEFDAKLSFLGCVGLEDKLQPLVPECIRDCARGGIKVWMATGDTLETAKNVGLACNMFDCDMIPSFSENDALTDCVRAYQDARLREITGTWATVASDSEQLSRLFDGFDIDSNHLLDQTELCFFLQSVQCNIDQEKIFDMFKSIDRTGTGITKPAFMKMMKSIAPSPFEAVLYDLDESIRCYQSIDDHASYPIGLVVNRTAFEVMFPENNRLKSDAAQEARIQKLQKRSLWGVSDGEKEQRGVTGKKTVTFVDEVSVNRGTKPKKYGAALGEVNLPATAAAVLQATETTTDEQREMLRRKFFALASVSKSVVFAEARPSMKKRIVQEMRARIPKAVILAVGDGANDVEMLKRADVGVGIVGNEGSAVSNAADYMIGSFRFLHDLLFVHGFWNFHRIADLISFIFYKAVLLAMTSYWFGALSTFSGQQFFHDKPLQFYNIMFTALPLLVVAIFDQNLPRYVLQNNPVAYAAQKCEYTGLLWSFGGWCFRGLIHSLIVFFVPYFSLGINNVADAPHYSGGVGQTHGIWFYSTTVYICVVLTPTLMVLTLMHHVTIVHVLSILLSLICLFLVTFLASVDETWNIIGSSDLIGVVERLYGSSAVWLTILLTVASPLLLELCWQACRRMFYPSLVQLLHERIYEARLFFEASEAGVNVDADTAVVVDEEDVGPVLLDSTLSHADARELLAMDVGDGILTNNSANAKKKLAQSPHVDGGEAMTSWKRDLSLRAAVVRTMYHIRNLTGSTFSSAASAELQDHDRFNAGTKRPSVRIDAQAVSLDDERKKRRRRARQRRHRNGPEHRHIGVSRRSRRNHRENRMHSENVALPPVMVGFVQSTPKEESRLENVSVHVSDERPKLSAANSGDGASVIVEPLSVEKLREHRQRLADERKSTVLATATSKYDRHAATGGSRASSVRAGVANVEKPLQHDGGSAVVAATIQEENEMVDQPQHGHMLKGGGMRANALLFDDIDDDVVCREDEHIDGAGTADDLMEDSLQPVERPVQSRSCQNPRVCDSTFWF